MQTGRRLHCTPHQFENLPQLNREEVALWNWYSRVCPNCQEWRSWLEEIFGHLLERPTGHYLQLVEGHLVEADYGEKVLSFGSRQELFIGRDLDNEVVLPAKAIASKHARLVLKNSHLFLEDLGGRLGTYLWDERIPPREEQPLKDGDQFSIFPYRFRVRLEQTWSPETEAVLAECHIQPRRRAEFLATSPVGTRTFIISSHPSGERGLLEVTGAFLGELQRRVLEPLGLDRARTRGETLPSDDSFAEFVILALLERLNRRLKFPLQFSFARGHIGNAADTQGISLGCSIKVGDLAGYFRVFLPLNYLSQHKSDSSIESESTYPAGLCWKFPVTMGFVDLSSDEVAQIGLGDILVTEHVSTMLFPNDFSKGWFLVKEESNSSAFCVDKYFERSMSVETIAPETASRPNLGVLPLRLHVVIGEKEFSLAEMQSFNVGTILELETLKSDPVRLMVNGKVLGEGELVDVEGKLAVKVLGWRSS